MTQLLGLKPEETSKDESSKNRYSQWIYLVTETDTDPWFDFINHFLDILEPKFIDLEQLGINSDKIVFWMQYEYAQQCAMEFRSQDLKRLGNSGIDLNINSWTKNK